MRTKGQKGFAIVNIIVGVYLVMAAFVMFGDPSVGPAASSASPWVARSGVWAHGRFPRLKSTWTMRIA